MALEPSFRTHLELPNGIPSHDTFGEDFSRLDSEGFPPGFMEWTQGVADLLPGEVVAMDGRTVRRSRDGNVGEQAIHRVSAWASANRLTLGQVKTEEKSNEITAIPQLQQRLELRGRIVTIDALGCPKAIAQAILEREAQYVLALKGNQGRLYQEVQDLFAGAEEFGYRGVPHDYANTLNRNHGRVEWRERRVINDPLSPAYLSAGQDWPGLKSAVRVVGHRETAEGSTVQPRCCISCWRQYAPTGAARTLCTGAWTGPSGKTNAGFAGLTRPRTWRRCGKFPPTC